MSNLGRYLASHSKFLAALRIAKEGQATDAAAKDSLAKWLLLTEAEATEAKLYQEASWSPTLHAYLLAEERCYQLVQAGMDNTDAYDDAYGDGCDAWYALSEEEGEIARKMYAVMRAPVVNA